MAGYPLGGDSLSITKGIVSRVTMTRYAHASNKLLGIQIDAAINPGNSGGPAFADLKLARPAAICRSEMVGEGEYFWSFAWLNMLEALNGWLIPQAACGGGNQLFVTVLVPVTGHRIGTNRCASAGPGGRRGVFQAV